MADRIGNTIAKAYMVGDKTKKYYKWVPWEQPIMTSNTMYGNLKGSSQHGVSKVGTRYFYRMFDKDTTTTDGRINHWSPSNSVLAWWCWELPVQLKITKITIYGESYYSSAADWSVVGQFYTDATKSTKVGEELVIDAQGQVKEIVIPDGIIVTALYFDKTGGGAYGGFDQIDIEATTPIEVAPGEDYDFTTSNTVIKMPTYKPKRKYFQRVFRPWNYTPALTSNTSDPNFIVSASSYLNGDYAIWKSFAAARNTTYPWISNETKTGWYQIKTTSKLRINRIHILNRSYNADTGSLKTFIIKGSLDGETWEDIGTFTNSQAAKASTYWVEVNSKKAYYYHKFDILESNQTVTWCSLGFPTIYADEEYSKREVSADDDWEFYEDYDSVTHAATYVERKYYKNGNEANVELFGTLQDRKGKIGNYYTEYDDPTIIDVLMTEFKSGNYAIIPKYPTSVQSYEIVLKFKIFSYNEGRVIGNYKTNVSCPQLEVPSSATANDLDWLHPNGSAWVKVSCNKEDVLLNEWCWLKATWDGIYVRVYTSKDGDNYTYRGMAAITTCSWKEQIAFGIDEGGYFLNGEIDLNECYIIVNGEMWWRGTRPVECSKEEAEWSELINIDKPIN